MTFQPVIPLGGFAGWSFLNRTIDTQQQTFNAQPRIQRLSTYFAENIGQVQTSEDLINDRQLLEVALGAFGLDEDIDFKAFIQKVLDEGTLNEDAFANKLNDPRYKELTEAFKFDLGTPSTKISTFADEILAKFEVRQFEKAVGEVNDDMRLALNLQREIGEVATSDNSELGKWFSILGNEPLRTVFETALGLPTDVGLLDVDQQVEIFQSRAARAFGDESVAQFNDPDVQDELVRRFFALGEIEAITSNIQTGASAALFLLQN